MELRKRLFIGCLGALTPILINLFIIDLQTVIPNLQPLVALSYAVRVAALCAAACIVVYLNSDESKPIKLFQLGIMAPALVTSMLNGAALSSKTPPSEPPAVANRPAAFNFPSIVGSALAQGGENRGAIPILNCLKPQDPTVTQQILKGFVGIVPDNQWFVVVESDQKPENAIARVNAINARFPGKFEAKVCAPTGKTDTNYRVVIGQYLTYAAASKLKNDAISAGLPSDSWVWNPSTATQ